jgi:hypothetical protein
VYQYRRLFELPETNEDKNHRVSVIRQLGLAFQTDTQANQADFSEDES